MKLIINADDFGYSKGVNLGIIEAHRQGIVSSTTLMVNMPGSEHAFSLIRDNPRLGVGIHLVLTCGSPLCKDLSSLMDKDGIFHRMDAFEELIDVQEAAQEFKAQVEYFLDQGLRPTHIDSHHHVHRHPKLLAVVLDLAKNYGLPLRLGSKDIINEMGYPDVKTTDYFNEDFFGQGATLEHITEIINKSKIYQSAEIMCHPAFVDYAVLRGSSYNVKRAEELAILTDKRLKELIEGSTIKLATFSDIL